MNNNALTATNLLTFARNADDLEVQASLEADMREAEQVASRLGGEDPVVTAALLLAGAAKALAGKQVPWALLDAADSVIADLRLANGCEDWATADWNSPEVGAVSELAETAIELRQQARALREAHLAAVREALDARQAA